MIDTIHIYFSGDELLDRSFAHSIAESVRYYGTPVFHDVDEMDRADARGENRSEYGKAMATIFVLSPSMLSKPHNRAKLISSAPYLGMPDQAIYYICRGITNKELRQIYPDLSELFDRVLVGDESDLAEMIAQIRDYAARSKEFHSDLGARIGWVLANALRYSLSFLVVVLGPLHYLLYGLSFFSPIVLWYLLTVSSPLHSVWEIAWASLALYGIGLGMNSLLALDFWPWLGRRWRLLELRLNRPDRTILLVVWLHLEWMLFKFDPPFESDAHLNTEQCFKWLAEDCLKLSQTDASQSVCTEDELRCAASSWLSTARRKRLALLAWLLSLLIPAIIVLRHYPWSITLTGLMASFIGLLFPPLFYWATNLTKSTAYWQTGLTEQEIRRQDRILRYALGGRGRVLLQSIHSSRARRRWFGQTDRVFISYSWEDEKNMPVAANLGECFKTLGVRFFLDKREVGTKFSPWRSQVSAGLLDCTHLFVVIGPNIVNARIALREIKMSLQRWHDELFPAIICVVDPNVATAVMQDAALSDDLSFILTWCPRLTYTEASDQDLVGYLLRQRRRQGLLRDLATMLLPGLAIKRTIIEAQSQMTHLNSGPKRFDRSRRSEF